MSWNPKARITYKLYTPTLGVAWAPPAGEEIVSENPVWIGGLLGGTQVLIVVTRKVTFVP